MSELTPELAAEAVAASQENADEAAGALGRAFDGEFSISVGEATSYDADVLPDGFDGPGLALLMKYGDVGACVLLPESSGMLPDWYATPDISGEGKLNTLAQEFSMLLMPETLMANDFKGVRVENLSEALQTAGVAEDAALVPLPVTAGERTAELTLIWPLATPDELLPQSKVDDTEPAAAEPTPAAPSRPKITSFSELPKYTQSLLRISLPVRVVLATKKETLQNVVELAAGSIIKFEKSCDEMLHLQVGEHKIALGEAVKVNDKFGFRVGEMVMPDEHFMKVKKTG